MAAFRACAIYQTLSKVYAAFRLNIFSPRLAGCLQQSSILFFFLALSVVNSCESNALPPIKSTEIINKSTGIKGCLQDHIASSVCLSLSQPQQLLLSSYLDFPAVPSSQLVFCFRSLLPSFTVLKTTSPIFSQHCYYKHDLFIIMKLMIQDYNGGDTGRAQ